MRNEDATEQAWKNGAEHMRRQVLDKLLSLNATTLGLSRAIINDIIDMVRKMEVRH